MNSDQKNKKQNLTEEKNSNLSDSNITPGDSTDTPIGDGITDNGTTNNDQENLAAEAIMKGALFRLEGWLNIFFIVSIFSKPHLVNYMAFSVCILGWTRECGMPQFNNQYLQDTIQNDYIQDILYMIPFLLSHSSRHLVYCLPFAIHFWTGACEFMAKKNLRLYVVLKKYIDICISQADNLRLQKARLEIFILPYLFIFFLATEETILVSLTYLIFLIIKYRINNVTRKVFADAGMWLKGNSKNNVVINTDIDKKNS